MNFKRSELKTRKYLVGALLLLLLAPLTLFAQQSDEILLTIDDTPITKDEFVRLYQKNNKNLQDDSLKKSPEVYLELFINYKLKVMEAKELKMDTVASFQKEFKQYRNQVAKPYLSYSNINDESLHQAYDRMTTEVKASHILIAVSLDALPADVDAAYQKCLKIRQQILDGADFGEMARQFSNDPSAAQNNGLLGYFTGFQMVPEFEDAAFSLKTGELSMPVRTKFGFHLIRLEDKRPAAGKLQVAHIMKRLSPAAPDDLVARAMAEMDSLKTLLDNGASFTELARRYSDDKQTAMNGGVLPWFTATEMVPEFAEAALKLKNNGDISPVVRTPYGLHLIKLLDRQPIPTFEESKSLLTEKVRNNPVITEHNQELFIQHLKDEYQFEENIPAKVAIIEIFPQEFDKNKGSVSLGTDELLFQFDSVQISQQNFIDYLNTKNFNSTQDIRQQANHYYIQFVNETLLQFENDQLESKYPDFRYLVQEYYDGILLFNLSEEKVWEKAATDTLGLQQFYAQHNDLVKWDERFEGWAIRCENQEIRDYIDDIFEEDDKLSKEELTDLLNIRFQNQAFVQKGIFARGTNDLVDYLVWDGTKPQNFKDGLYFVRGDLVPPSPKTLEEARGQYLSAYQDELEQEWVADLRRAHKIRVNKKVLKSIENIK
ncbi:peptidylprolyl isomerase [Mangrovibacterium diazotrophicum]|uniref:Peptidyl-prolyl cis-trans isomerase SurA n=1 Tax=Mangrovibacterium diazotrophicum TaxID=1261403 RepID=A0A419W3T3_9BACT|nr:peptidylprolyl isomerase [Mangrovibacterium diazotrophicum]RKD90146.1 peptidyl-prolyl cis-trans isomerase SurA [Mangrovibacterium diazotrophicum]